MVKRGDTLIEVTLAVGIFSMIAVAVVATMSSGTTNAQTALETTLARAEIDAQAEALRFIQTSASANKPGFDNLWNDILNKAHNATNSSEEDDPNNWAVLKDTITNFAPSSCSELYNTENANANNIYNQNAFIIDTSTLGEFITQASSDTSNSLNPLISTKSDTGDSDSSNINPSFSQATTYPRVYKENNTVKAEGLYVVAVKDSGARVISANAKSQAFYDFYIHACWDTSNSDHPSTISTVIRLLGEPK
jgi:Tfp pilus assembly protein PilV